MPAGIVAGGYLLYPIRTRPIAIPIHVGRLPREALQVSDEGLGFGEGLGVLHALHIIFVCVSVRGPDGDDPLGPSILSLR
jgi:hypothetical protein